MNQDRCGLRANRIQEAHAPEPKAPRRPPTFRIPIGSRPRAKRGPRNITRVGRADSDQSFAGSHNAGEHARGRRGGETGTPARARCTQAGAGLRACILSTCHRGRPCCHQAHGRRPRRTAGGGLAVVSGRPLPSVGQSDAGQHCAGKTVKPPSLCVPGARRPAALPRGPRQPTSAHCWRRPGGSQRTPELFAATAVLEAVTPAPLHHAPRTVGQTVGQATNQRLGPAMARDLTDAPSAMNASSAGPNGARFSWRSASTSAQTVARRGAVARERRASSYSAR